MKNLPNITGYFKAADTILGNLGGIVVFGIIVALIVAVIGLGLGSFFFLISTVGIGIELAGYLLIGVLSVLAIILLLIMVILGNG